MKISIEDYAIIISYANYYLFTRFVPLQAKKPNTRISPPRAERGTECPGIAMGCPSVLSNLPCRGPIKTQPTNAHTAENHKEMFFIITMNIDSHIWLFNKLLFYT